MTFKDIKTGYNIYMLHKGDDMSLAIGKVISVSAPRIPQGANMFQPNQTQQLVVDITIDENGQQKTYTIPDMLEVTYAGTDLAIATSKEAVVREIEAMKGRADDVIGSIDKQRKISSQCAKLLEEYNPAMKEKRENEERFQRLEVMMEKIMNKLG